MATESTSLLGGLGGDGEKRASSEAGSSGWKDRRPSSHLEKVIRQGSSMFGSGGMRHLEDWRQKASDDFIILSTVALLGLVLAVVVNETLWYSAVGFETMDNGITTLLKILILSLSLVSFFFLYAYYSSLLEVLRKQGVELEPGFSIVSLWESRLLGNFIMDLLILLPQPLPFVHYTVLVGDLHHEGHDAVYTSDNIFMGLMFLRILFLPRLISEFGFRGKSMTFVMARMNYVEIDTWFVLRSLFVANFSTLLFLIGTTIMVFAYIILLCERPYPKADELTEFMSCLWLTLITMTTVGYGDVVPLTKMGRFVSAINACLGVVFLSLVIQGVVQRVKMTHREQRVIDYMQESEVRNGCRQSASTVMAKVYLQYKENCKMLRRGQNPTKVKVHPRVRAVLMDFRQAHRAMKTCEPDPEVFISLQVRELKEDVKRMSDMITLIADKLNLAEGRTKSN